jgi:DNA methylase
MTDSLIVLSQVERRLAAITTVDEAKSLRDHAEAIRLYAKKIKAGLHVQNRAAAIKLLAEQRAGELLAAAGERRGGVSNFPQGSLKSLPPGITWTQSHRWRTIATVPASEILAREAAHTDAGKELTSREIYTKATGERREQANKRTLSTQVQLESEALGIHHGDFRELAASVLPDCSVQLVFTDPPYDEHSLTLFEAAAREAARVLLPGGSFLAYSGQKYLAAAIAACSQHLTYWWLFALIHNGPSQLLQKLGVRCHWKPILWFVKNTRGDVTDITADIVHGAGREKDLHEWQQGEAEAATLIECLTKPGDLVVDFMAGGGTIPAAAKRLQRRVVAFESRADNVEKIMERIA